MMYSSQTAYMTIDVEEWFHILDDRAVPDISMWDRMEARLPQNLERILTILSEKKVKATMFWLGWIAERYPSLVRVCMQEGHEIASHGYGHVLPYEVSPGFFANDIERAKKLLEDISGEEVLGFRAAGFGVTRNVPWFFDLVRAAGYLYDSSIFPARRGHGGMPEGRLEPHKVRTSHGSLTEIPQSVVNILGLRVSLFGGGYLRIAPLSVIKWGAKQVHRQGRPLVIYVHPREVDPDSPRLPLKWYRRFKAYVNVRSTKTKLEWLCDNFRFRLVKSILEENVSS